MQELLSDPYLLWFIFGTFLIGGFVKGMVAIGLPTVSLALLAQILDTHTAINLILFPLLISNMLLALRGGNHLRTFSRYKIFILVQVVFVITIVIITRDLDASVLKRILGFVVILFALVGLARAYPRIEPKFDRILQPIFGGFAGMLAGTVAAWAPAVVIYLSIRDVDKQEFARASGMIITIGAIPLIALHFGLGKLSLTHSGLSIVALIPALLGYFLGERVRARISELLFKTALFCMFLILGLNLVLR